MGKGKQLKEIENKILEVISPSQVRGDNLLCGLKNEEEQIILYELKKGLDILKIIKA